MAVYSLFPTRPVVTTATSSVPFICGTSFEVTSGGCWFPGYWWYAGGATAPQKFCLHCITGGPGAGTSTASVVVPGSVVTSGALTANSWNYVPLATPIPICIATPYMAATGFTISGAFANQHNMFGTGDPYVSGITSGPLFGFSDSTGGGTAGTGNPWQIAQGTFATSAGTDPTAHLPTASGNSSFYGIDVSISDTAPSGWTGPFSFYPGTAWASVAATADLGVNYEVALEGIANQAVTCTAVRYFSFPGVSQLATWIGVWDVASKTLLASSSSPSWSGAAGSGWVQASLPVPASIGAGKRFKIAVYNGNSSAGTCFTKDTTDRWGTGLLANGIVNGPITAPGLSNASSAYNYNNNPAGNPPYSDGTLLSHGQSIFGQTAAGGSSPPYPLLWASAGTADGTQDYFIDGLFYLAPSGLLMASYI